MNVASLELSARLYELSGWESDRTWASNGSGLEFIVRSDDGELGHDIYRVTYAYDLGYLLRKLPHRIEFKDLELHKVYDDDWTAGYTYQDEWIVKGEADNPEDATVNLAIELFKQGILTK